MIDTQRKTELHMRLFNICLYASSYTEYSLRLVLTWKQHYVSPHPQKQVIKECELSAPFRITFKSRFGGDENPESNK